jgi:hypothetical protein
MWMRLRAEMDWTPGGTPDMPYGIMEPRSSAVDVKAGWRTKDGTEYLLMQVDDAPGPTTYDRRPGLKDFSWTPWPLGNWVPAAMALEKGETRKVKNRWITRMTDAAIQALEPIYITFHNPH